MKASLPFCVMEGRRYLWGGSLFSVALFWRHRSMGWTVHTQSYIDGWVDRWTLDKFYSYDDRYENTKSICSWVDWQYCVLTVSEQIEDGFRFPNWEEACVNTSDKERIGSPERSRSSLEVLQFETKKMTSRISWSSFSISFPGAGIFKEAGGRSNLVQVWNTCPLITPKWKGQRDDQMISIIL